MRPLLLAFIFLTSVSNAQTQWGRTGDYPGPERDDGVSVVVNKYLYVGTGLCNPGGAGLDFYRYTPTSVWQTIPSMPAGTERQYACAFPGTDCFFVFGGDNANGSLNTLYKFDITTQTWSVMAPKPGIGLSGACCMAFGDKVIIAGGKAQGSAPVNEVWEYSISGNSWVQKNNFPFGGRFRASAAVLNGKGYLMFGADDHDHFRKAMYRYDAASDSWTWLLDFPQPAARVYASLQPVSGKLMLFGGIDSTLACYNDVWYFDPNDNTWGRDADFFSFARKGGMAGVVDNAFFYTCGMDQNGVRLKETWRAYVPVGLPENELALDCVVSPNPANDLLSISAAENKFITVLTLTDITGKELLVKQNEPGKNTASLDLSTLGKGVYFLKIQSGEAAVWKKIVKE